MASVCIAVVDGRRSKMKSFRCRQILSRLWALVKSSSRYLPAPLSSGSEGLLAERFRRGQTSSEPQSTGARDRPWIVEGRMKHRSSALYVTLVMFLSMIIVRVSDPGVRAQQPNQVGLVADFGNGRVATRCVEFSQSEISGYDVLRQSGLHIVANEVSGMGVTICDIGGASGCSASNCFCRCQGMTCTYWTYSYLEGGSWQYSPLGASARTVQHGDVEGWAWGEGNTGGGAQPPVLSFEQICSISGAPATAEPPASPTDAPTLPPTPATLASATPSPFPSPSAVATPILSSTTSPTVQPTLTPSPTMEATKSSSLTSTGDIATARPSPTRMAPASPSPSESSSASQSVTPSPIAEAQTTTAPVQVAKVESSEEGPIEEEQAAPPTESDSPSSPLIPTGTIAFGLIVGALLSWLIYVLKFRGHRA